MEGEVGALTEAGGVVAVAGESPGCACEGRSGAAAESRGGGRRCSSYSCYDLLLPGKCCNVGHPGSYGGPEAGAGAGAVTGLGAGTEAEARSGAELGVRAGTKA